jgi:Protein of unknown function (DUF2950)
MKYFQMFDMTRFKPSLKTNVLTLLFVGILGAVQGCACDKGQARFSSPDKAVHSLIATLRANDQAKLARILGPDGDKVISSGDAVADRQGVEKFVKAYDAKHSLITSPDGSVTLVVGEKDWPTPIPLVKAANSKKWIFDTKAGEEEILNRRIGHNELTVIQVCQAIADAQREYAERDPDGDGIPEYASKFISDPGKKNGLYWPTSEGETPSPLGALVADAVEQGYNSPTAENNPPHPYHGYLYRMLTSQGSDAPGGASDYIINGQMLGGFAAVAYPAEYGNSGVMTFMVDSHGAVYQKNLGPGTEQIATVMSAFNPDSSWQKVEAPAPEQP